MLAKAKVAMPPKPTPDRSSGQTEKILRLLGLGVRGRGVVVGVDRVREAGKTGKLAVALVAMDASKNSLEKLLPLLNARRINLIEVPSAAELGAAVGRDQTAAVGVVDPALAKGIVALTRTGSSRASEEGV
jgi:ribosomal protein L7Ae-like RNA K-turn-binding protein